MYESISGWWTFYWNNTNQPGHGFYQFSPELFFRVFSEQNGFRVKKVFIRLLESNREFYVVADPKDVSSRVEFINDSLTFMNVIAEKIKEVEKFSTPQQVDYQEVWDRHEPRVKTWRQKMRIP